MAVASQPGPNAEICDISEIARTPEGKALLKRSLDEVTGGAAFKGSHRGAQFLEYVVRHSSLGETDRLKERLIGVELFGRLPSYDTGDDAIVRVTASDVRKRLLQHYSQAGSNSEFRITLPSGKYRPELIRNPAFEPPGTPAPELRETPSAHSIVVPIQQEPQLSARIPARGWKYWILPISGLLMMIVSVALVLGNRLWHTDNPLREAATTLPWAAIFDGSRPVLVVASDPNIKEIQRIAHSTISLSDYANEHYLPSDTANLSPSEITFMREILRGDKISSYDGGIIAGLASLMRRGEYRLAVKGARGTRVQDLQADGNLIFLGSPRSNPWARMYDDRLDFRFVFDEKTESEMIHNVHPGSGEVEWYAPTAVGFGTGESFATIAVLARPGRTGRVLIIAGANAEGTEAAGMIVTDPARWEMVQQACRLPDPASEPSVQLLIQLGTMAGSAENVKVIACHVLNPAS